jgi:uncharacterized protein with von Willebrand factor type A (vWA) domain
MSADNVIKADGFDAFAFGSQCQDIRELTDTPVNRDIWTSLYKLRPAINEQSSARHKSVIEGMMETREWKELRETTKLSEAAATLATLKLAPEINAKLPPEKDKNKPMSDDTRRALRAIAKAVAEETQEDIDNAMAFLAGEGHGTDVNPQGTDAASLVRIAMALKRNPKLAQIAKIAGRMRLLAERAHRNRPQHGPDEIVDIETGNAIPRLLPMELIAAGNPTLRLDFERRFIEKQLLMYRMESKEPEGRGPIIVCLDSSVSMIAPFADSTREVWSKAVALTLMQIAAKERRDFCLIHFGINCDVRRFKRNPDSSDIMKGLMIFHNAGGTEFIPPLDNALAICEESSFRKADIVFITDGESSLTEAWREDWRKRANAIGTRLHAIFVGANGPDLESISDTISHIDPRDAKDSEALDIAFSI